MLGQEKKKTAKFVDSPLLKHPATQPQLTFGTLFAAKKVSKKFGERSKKKSAQAGAPADEKEDKYAEYRQLVKRYGVLARVMCKGDSFGETAITQPGTNRTASILCKTDCHFLIIDEQTYKEHLKRTADKKTEILMKTFSFLTQVSSTHIRNLLVNNFQNEVFSKDDIITMEGPVTEKPYFYVLDNGFCKVEKRYFVETKNPYSKNQVFHKQCKWITLCTIEHGTLIGEEILLQPNKEEHYEYKVTVVSKSATLLKTDKSFLGIHPDLETPIQQFYLTKKEQRDEIYNNLIQEYNLKEKMALKNPEVFLKEHSNLAGALRKSSLDVFSMRSKRSNDRFEMNKLPQDVPPNTDRAHVKQPAPQFVTKRSLQLPIALQRSDTVFSAGGLPSVQAVASAKPSLPNNSVILSRGLTFSSTKQTLTPEPNIGQFKTDLDERSPNANSLWNSPDVQEITTSDNALEDTSLKSPILQMIQTSYNVKKQFRKENDNNLPKLKQEDKAKMRKSKTIRQVEQQENLKQKENARQSVQFLAQMNFLHLKEEPESVNVNDIGNFKFVFAKDKETRVHEILKQKYLKLGVFSSRESINYIQRSESPQYNMLKRINKDKGKDFSSPIRIMTESSALGNKNSPRETLSSPLINKTSQSDKQRVITTQNREKKFSLSLAASSQYGFMPPTKYIEESIGTEVNSPTIAREQFEGSIHFLTARTYDSGILTSQTVKSELQRLDTEPGSRNWVAPIHCHSDLPDVSEICKNQKYTNLVQKSINNKKLFVRKNQNTQISRKGSTDTGKMADSHMKLKSSHYSRQTPSP